MNREINKTKHTLIKVKNIQSNEIELKRLSHAFYKKSKKNCAGRN